YGASATQSFTITVVGENLPPLITSETPTQAQVNKLYTYAVQAGDADGDTLRYSVTGGYYGQAQISAAGLMTWTPSSTGTFNFTVTVNDRPTGDPQNIATTQSWVV